MKRTWLRMGLAWALLVASSGSALAWGSRDGDSADCLKTRSQAWCTLDAAKMTMLGLKDVKAEDLRKSLGTEGRSDAWWYGGAAVGLGSGYFKPAPGLTPQAEIAVLVLGFLGGSMTPSALGWNGVFGWMPLAEADNEEAARELAAATVRKAILGIFSKYEMTLEWEPDDDQKAPYMVSGKGRPVYVLKGGDCETRTCKLSILNTWGAVQKVKKPEWMGGGDAWGIAVGYGVQGAALSPWRLVIDGVDSTPSYLSELSRALPDWAYVWVSPEVKKKWGQANVGQRVPGLYTKGEFMPMVFPELGGKQRAAADDGAKSVAARE